MSIAWSYAKDIGGLEWFNIKSSKSQSEDSGYLPVHTQMQMGNNYGPMENVILCHILCLADLSTLKRSLFVCVCVCFIFVNFTQWLSMTYLIMMCVIFHVIWIRQCNAM